MNRAKAGNRTLHIVIPVYNEGANFAKVHREIRSKVRVPCRILVVYDFDGDDTLPIVRKLMRKDRRLSLVRNARGRGVLNALRTGFDRVPSGPILVVMGDLSDDLSAVGPMLEKYREGCQVVCGSRYMPGGSQEGGPWLKRTLSRWAGLSLHALGFPTHDATNNFRLYDKALLQEIDLESRAGFELAMEITVKAHRMGRRVGEVPTAWKDRTAGTSRFNLWKWLPHYLRWYLHALRPGQGRPSPGGLYRRDPFRS